MDKAHDVNNLKRDTPSSETYRNVQQKVLYKESQNIIN
jgi:hypothetical protein